MFNEIKDFAAPELDVYARTSEVQLLRYYEPEPGIFIAESPKVIERALKAGYQPISFLVEHKDLEGEAQEILKQYSDVPVYTAEYELLVKLTGFARNRIVRNVTVSAARREIQIPFNPNNFASITAQITIATIPLRNDPTIAILGSSTAEKYATSTILIPATINPRKYRRSPVCA